MITFIGFKNVGKSYWGKRISCHFKIPFFDLDDLIEKEYARSYGTNLSIRDIYIKLGDENFRNLETFVLKQVPVDLVGILSLGGGTLDRTENQEFLQKKSFLIFLKKDFFSFGFNDQNLPKFVSNLEELHQKFLLREQIYLKCSHASIDLEDINSEDEFLKLVGEKISGK